MATMNISLPDELKAYVEARVKSGEYANASDFVRDLIRHDRSRDDYDAWLRDEIESGIASGTSDRSVHEVLAEARQASYDAGHDD